MKISKFVKGLSIALFLPLAFFFFFRIVAGDGHVPMPPFYNIDKIDSIQKKGKWLYDTSYHCVGDLQVENQLEEKLSLNTTLKNKILVVSFMDLHDKNCKLLNNNLQFLERAYKKSDSNMHYISININPADSIAQLRKYSDSIKANTDKWYFCTANKEAVQNYIHHEIRMPNADNDLLKKWIVVDFDRNVRGFYNGIDTLEIRRCAEDISRLKMEKKKKHTFK